MGIQAWLRKRRVTDAILRICLEVKKIEEENTQIVKFKLLQYKKLAKKKEAVDDETIQDLIKATTWQKNTFDALGQISYIVETNTKDVKFDGRTKPLQEKIIGARAMLDRLESVYNSQLNTLKSIITNEQKKQRLRDSIKEELAIYREYQKMRKKVPLEALAHLEAEWDENKTFIKIGGVKGQVVKHLITAVAASITLGIAYLVIDDPELRERILQPEYIIYILAMQLPINKIKTELKKIKKHRKLSKLLKS
jgi:hypothetical protein